MKGACCLCLMCCVIIWICSHTVSVGWARFAGSHVCIPLGATRQCQKHHKGVVTNVGNVSPMVIVVSLELCIEFTCFENCWVCLHAIHHISDDTLAILLRLIVLSFIIERIDCCVWGWERTHKWTTTCWSRGAHLHEQCLS